MFGSKRVTKDMVMGAYRQTQMVKHPQTANARGYLSYAYFQAQED